MSALSTPVAHEQWITAHSPEDGFLAATINDNGSIFGEVCQEKCIWFVTLDQVCEPGSTYPTLANTQNGAVMLSLVCDKQVEQKWRYYFPEFESVQNAVTDKGDRMGFAIPIKDGSFIVARFSLHGADAAVNEMLDQAIQANKRSTSDLRL